ncbi:PEP-CTERM sorting domain-containing protein [Psychromonas antarctica]|uniref:PEP-CTERM sorting domain-containing protein n=1 Tax=Psychromonas antarctica TaxID=67573 RepID=UPI001EE97F14|nr:PEP-CTERM sorting domain-containing protein [Psychromonas antarctica]MCG6201839.1 hypothetical protein [Psychromonas antarctica]
MLKLLSAVIITVSALSAHTADAAFINILNDQTTAHAQVRYNPGVVSNPGTTLDTFSGSLFPSAVFSGYSLNGDRSATIPIDDDFFDTTSFSSYNEAYISSDFYRFVVNLGTGEPGQYGATGNASAQTDLSLRFQVTGGSSSMDLYAAKEGNSPVQLSLYNETLSVLVENLMPSGWNYQSAYDVTLYDNHIYSLTGSLYADTDLSGDPSSNFGFKFNDALTIASVPAPSALAIMMIALMGLGFKRIRIL